MAAFSHLYSNVVEHLTSDMYVTYKSAIGLVVVASGLNTFITKLQLDNVKDELNHVKDTTKIELNHVKDKLGDVQKVMELIRGDLSEVNKEVKEVKDLVGKPNA
jgi:peptidoglycan hydrolase CwlO-like protein